MSMKKSKPSKRRVLRKKALVKYTKTPTKRFNKGRKKFLKTSKSIYGY